VAQRDRVVAGVEDEHRHRPGGVVVLGVVVGAGEAGDQVADLGGGGVGGVGRR
jgi:hypothetical protein